VVKENSNYVNRNNKETIKIFKIYSIKKSNFVCITLYQKRRGLTPAGSHYCSSQINNKNFLRGRFYCQEVYGGFSYSRSQLNEIYNYILNQQEHHKKFDFKTEYLKLLEEFEIEYKPEYLFDFDIIK